MPPKKLKKPPTSAYGLFMIDYKREKEDMGYRFPGGMKDVAEACAGEWREMSKEEKAVYEARAKEAKEAGKSNLNNKFTTTGESYAQLQAKYKEIEEEKQEMENLLNSITTQSRTPIETKNFIVIKTIHSCLDHNTNTYYPLELAMGAFNLADGLKCNYWTLINTKIRPPGYACEVKETAVETALPEPGSKIFKDSHSDYKRILSNFKKFIEKYLPEKDYPRKYAVFTIMKEVDLKAVVGCINWLYENAKDSIDEAEIPEWDMFFRNLKFFRLPKLVLQLALITKAKNPDYRGVMAMYNDLEEAAIKILNSGVFDYRPDITCDHHKIGENSYKMHICCKNIVLRSIYLLVGYFVEHMKLPKREGHDIEVFKKKSSSNRTTVPISPSSGEIGPRSAPTSQKVPPVNEANDIWNKAKSGRASNTDSFPANNLGSDGESMLSASQDAPQNELEDIWNKGKSSLIKNPAKRPVKEEPVFDDGPLSSGFVVAAARNPSQSFALASKREPSTPSFDDDDFPSLGAALKQEPSAWKRGRGRGSGGY